jgi:16S rRNA (cytosine1402-N4)-methyltransferase
MNQQKHIPVLLQATLDYLNPQAGERYLDLTAGYGGHASAIAQRTNDWSKMVLVDRDEFAIKHLQNLKANGAQVIQADFLSACQRLRQEGQIFDMILLDLGVSSPHLDDAVRGFSFQQTGPLDMRMDQSQSVSAATIVNEATAAELEKILKEYGEEPRARRVAAAIIDARPISTTTELAEIVRLALPGPRQKRHPATKTFQAIRIAVNQELSQLEQTLPILLDLLAPGGRVAVISFHSLEDRIVKRFFKEETENGYESRVEALTKKPISGDDDVFNPRARSAKLRVARNPR